MRTFIIAAIIGLVAGLIWSVAVGPWGWGVDTAGAAEFEVCASVRAETGGDSLAVHAAGCKDDGTRAGGMCNRYAYRLAKSWMRKTPGHAFTPYMESLIQRVEQQSSNGHPCRHYEDYSYGFPSKQIDCAVDPRC